MDREPSRRPGRGSAALAVAVALLLAAVAVALGAPRGEERAVDDDASGADPGAFFAAKPPHAARPSPRGLGISLDNPEFSRRGGERARARRRRRDRRRLGPLRRQVVGGPGGGPDAWDWARYDELVTAARLRGLILLVNLAYSPPWARPEGVGDKHGPDTDERREAFAHFVAATVRRYRDRVAHWEIWNEPNNTMFWQPESDPEAYAALLHGAYTAAKAVDGRALVIGGATAPASTGEGRVDEVEFLERVYEAGGREFFDAWSHHPYDFNLPPGTAHPDSGWWQMYGSNPSIRSVMQANGDGGKKLWATEHGVPSQGYGSLDERDQAEWLRRAYRLWRGFPWAGGPIFNYMLRDGPSPENADYWSSLGLERSDATRKPAEDAVPDP